MGGHEILTRYTPFFIMALSLIIILGLYKLYKHFNDYQYIALIVIPASFFIAYFWIATFEPSIESARDVVRIVISLGMGNAITVIFGFLSKLRRKGEVKKYANK
jgi:hypothetical protein